MTIISPHRKSVEIEFKALFEYYRKNTKESYDWAIKEAVLRVEVHFGAIRKNPKHQHISCKAAVFLSIVLIKAFSFPPLRELAKSNDHRWRQ